MASHSRTAEREEERRLNIRTLVIASVASAAAALLTSRLSTAGTWIAAAMTPVIVSLVSEMLHRPTERLAKSLTSDRRSLAAAGGAGPPAGPGPDPLAGRAPMEPSAGVGEARPPTPGLGSEAPIRVYRAGESSPRAGRRSGRDQAVGARGRGPGGRGEAAGASGPGAGAGGGAAGGRDLGAGARGGAAGERDLGAGARGGAAGDRGVGAGAAGRGAGARGVGPAGRGREGGGRGAVPGAPGMPPLDRRPVRRRRRIAFGAVFATAGLAFVIAVAALTLPELVAGGSVGKSDGRTTFFGGGGNSNNRDRQQAPQDTTPEEQQQPEEQQEPRQPTTPEEETTPTTEEPPPAEEAPSQQSQPGEPLTETTPAPPPAQP
jgi:hypothetical protein